jgi:peptide/nickel transport system substrate-binding protein
MRNAYVAKTLLGALGLIFGSPALPADADAGRINATTIPHVLRIGTAEDIRGLDPDLSSAFVLSLLSQMTGAYLFRSGHDNGFIPELAVTIPTFANGGISRDGRTITIELRHGVTWSDGRPFDASDVAFSIDAINNKGNDVPTRDGFDQIVKVDVPNKYRVVVHLRAPYGAIVADLFSTANTYAILPKHLLGSLPDINRAPFNDLPIGIGPFKYSDWKRGDSVELEANPSYWRGRPKLDRVILKILPDRNTLIEQLQTGEIDLWGPIGGAFFGRVQAIPSVATLRSPGYAFNVITLNTRNAALAEVAVRRALQYATDRATIVAKIAHGVGILQDTVAPAIDPDSPKDIPFTAYDPAKANALLDADGWIRAADGIRMKGGRRLSFEVASTVGSPDVDAEIELIRSSWKDAGVEISVRRYQASLLFAEKADNGILNNGRFDIAFSSWDVNVPVDPTGLFGCDEAPPAGQNIGSFCDKKIDAALADLHTTYDVSRRRADLSRAFHRIADDVPAIVVDGRENIFALNRDLKNFHPNALTVFDDMLDVDI